MHYMPFSFPLFEKFLLSIYAKMSFLELFNKETLAGLKPVTSQHVYSVAPATISVKDPSLLVNEEKEQTKQWQLYHAYLHYTYFYKRVSNNN